ncbi:AHR protein, partial [Catharus fuscescens]|nr:AHR protein [Catharus fuscescens]
MYAGRKRKKPVPKSPKPPPPEGVKSNPSKRHRDRLNQELNTLTGLLPFPEDVRSRLDKLSILRLTVGYLKVKSYLRATAPKVGNCVDQLRAPGGDRWTEPQGDRELFPEGELLLQALNGFVIAVTGDGYIFYISPTVQDYLGFHQSDLIYQSVYELIHADDRATFRRQLHRTPLHAADRCAEQLGKLPFPFAFPAFPPEQPLLAGHGAMSSPQHLHAEKQSYVERSFTCRFRCLLDNSSGFLALNFHGRLKFLLGQQKSASDKSPVALFAIATLLQPLSILELRTKTLIFQTKHKLDFTPMACDSRGKVVLGYTEVELCRRGSGYQFVHAADMMHCAEHHVRMMKTGESGLTVFRLLTKRGGWVWVQANARLVYKGDKPDCIIARQRALSNEEGEEHLRKRNLQLPFSFATGEAVLYGNNVPGFLDSFQAKEELQVQANFIPEQHLVDPNSLLGAVMKQDASIYNCHADNVLQFSLPGFSPEPDGLSQNEDTSSAKEDSDPLLVVIQTLFEKREVAGNVCSSLSEDSTELQQWEEALLSLGAEQEPPAQGPGQRLATKVTSCVEQTMWSSTLREGAGKSLDFPPCHEENSVVAHFQRCWAAGSALPAQTRAAGTRGGQGAVGSVASVTSDGSSAQPEQQGPFNPAGLVAGTVLGVPISSSTSSAPLQLANQAIQAGAATSAPVDNTTPTAQSQPECQLVGSNTLVTLWHNVPVQANPATCPSEAWLAIALKQLEAAGAQVESQ